MIGRILLFVAGLGIAVGGGIGLLLGMLGTRIDLPIIFYIVLTSNFLIGFLTGVFWNHIITPPRKKESFEDIMNIGIESNKKKEKEIPVEEEL